MRFLIKLIFWFTLSLMMIADDRGGIQIFANPEIMDNDTIEYVLTARELTGKIGKFCANNPAACPDIGDIAGNSDAEDGIAALILDAEANSD